MGQRMTGVDSGQRHWVWRVVQGGVAIAALALYLVVVTRGRPADWVNW